MQSAEAREVGRAAGAVLSRGTALTRDAHASISDVVHSAVRIGVGPAATPVLAIQDFATRSVYALTGLGLSAAARSAGVVAEARMRAGDAERASVHDGPTAPRVLAAGLGLLGDQALSATLAPSLHVRHRGRDVPLTSAGLTSAYGDVTPQVVVFVHGLFHTEEGWRFGTPSRPSYPDRLRDELGLTPVTVRYNTGLRVADNGTALAGLLADLVAAWPVPIERLVLVGHSMGGLVIHRALASAYDEGWRSLVTDVVTLGSPHSGSPIARAVGRAQLLLAGSDRTRWAAELLDVRSLGIRDMELGHHPGAVSDDGIRRRFVVGVTEDLLPIAVAHALGDLVVPVSSASVDGEGDLVRANHLTLLNHPQVHEHLVAWLRPLGA